MADNKENEKVVTAEDLPMSNSDEELLSKIEELLSPEEESTEVRDSLKDLVEESLASISIDDIINQIESLDSTAAGAGTQAESEGGSAPVYVDYLNPEVIPEAGFDTRGVTVAFEEEEDEALQFDDVIIAENTNIVIPEEPPVDPEDPEEPPVDPEDPEEPPVDPEDPEEPPVDPEDPEEPPVDPKEKGNNGVGNGEDGQPPGNPPINDGPGTGPGNPGNKGGPNGFGSELDTLLISGSGDSF